MIERNDAIKRIRAALKARSGKSWSVTGGRGTAWGWIRISSPPARAANEFGNMTDSERTELGKLLGLEGPAHSQGVGIPSSGGFYEEYIDRAEGRKPTRYGERYWD